MNEQNPTIGLTIGLVGNPNCGKTTLFNRLTGSRQRVGNWPGVTVERKSGRYRHAGREVTVVDLPGVYSLDGGASLDEQVAQQYALSGEAQLIVNIVDASNLERNLYLTTQLLEMEVPLLVALNMMDAAEERGVRIDVAALAARLGCPVVPLVAARGRGVAELPAAIDATAAAATPPTARTAYPAPLEEAVTLLAGMVHGPHARWHALRLLEAADGGSPPAEVAAAQRSRVEAALGEEADIVVADARYAFIAALTQGAVRRRDRLSRTLSDRIDRVVLNRLLGIPLFLAMIYLMFLFTINLGGAFIDLFDGLAGTLLVAGGGELLTAAGAPDWLRVLLADGVGGGIRTVATFIPVIGFLFLFLSFLEDSGYMARAAFVMDRLMRAIGLPGKSFVPLIVGFGCNVPAVMATRTLENPRDRLLTMAMTPFMSCGARLPVYALFAAAFFPVGGQNVVFGLYLIGIAAAVLTGLALKHTLLPGEGSPFIMELPPYRLPNLRNLLLHTWGRLKSFLVKAGRVIVPMVLVLNLLNTMGPDGSFGHQESEESLLAAVGRGIAPAFAPLGVSEENWPAAVGVFTGVLAKEAVVGTLDALYSRIGAAAEEGAAGDEEPFDLMAGLTAAFATVPANLAGLGDALLDPLGIEIGDVSDAAAAAEEQAVAEGTFGAMARLFDGAAGAFAYLLLILLYFPCVAVLWAVYQEVGLRWATFMALWATGFGYGAAVLFYQLATFAAHPLQSLGWLALVSVLTAGGLLTMRSYGNADTAATADIPPATATEG